MTSRTAQFASRLVETGWLAAVITVPLFFNVWSNRVFEPDKLTLLRSIALIMAVGAVVLLLEGGRLDSAAIRRWLRLPLVAPVLIMTAVIAFASTASWTPRLSFLGSYVRLQGFYSWLAYVVVFITIVALLRRREQLDRLIQALILPSLPVALYGIVQKFGLDPMPWLGNVTIRVASTMGNSIFVAAYLIMVVPLTLVMLAAALRALDRDEGTPAVLRVSAYLVLLAVQIMAIVFSQSRGPILGFLGGVFFLLLLMGARRGRRWTLGILGLGAALAAFLVVFNLPGSPLAPLRDAPYLGRLGRVFETDRGTGKVRVLIWEGAIDLIRDDPLRMLIGYGPESMHLAYNRFYPPDLAHYESRNASPDRSHNETLDVLVQTGLIGFAAYLYLFTSLFYFGLKWLGFIGSNRERNLFLSLWLGGGVISVLGFHVWSGSDTFFGAALPAGMVAGLFAFVARQALTGWQPPERPGGLIVAGLVAALIAHFVEIHFGIAIAATRTLSFAMMGALVVVGALADSTPELLAAPSLPTAAPANTRRRSKRRRTEVAAASSTALTWTAAAFMVLVLVATLGYDLLVDVTSPSSTFVLVLTWLIGLAWMIGSLVVATEILVVPGTSLAGLGRYLFITLGGFVAYAAAHATVLYSGTLAAQAGREADTSSNLLVLFYLVLLTILLLWASALTKLDPAPTALSHRALWLYPLLFVAAIVVAFITNVSEVRADIYYKQAYVRFHSDATNYQAKGDWDNAELYYGLAKRQYDLAIALDPSEDYYLLFKGKVLLEEADGLSERLERQLPAPSAEADFSEYGLVDSNPELAAEVTQRDRAFEDALQVLNRALETAPRNTDHHANLGRAYQVWGDRTSDKAKRAERLALSRQWFQSSIDLSPNNAQLFEELATTEFLAGDTAAAEARIADALAIDPEYGRPYRLRATIRREDKDWPAAEADYRTYVESRDGQHDAFGWSALAYVLGQEGKMEDARWANEKVLALVPDDLATLRNLAIICRDLDDPAAACAYALRGLELAADDSGLRQLAAEMGCAGGVAPGAVPGAAGAADEATPTPATGAP